MEGIWIIGSPFFILFLKAFKASKRVFILYFLLYRNHEFDFGTAVLASFLGNLTAPAISCNVDVSKEPLLANKVQRFIVKTLSSGLKVGIIGFTPPDSSYTSSPGPLVKFSNPATVAAKCISDAKAAGAQMIVGLTHIGYDYDKELAAAFKDFDLIVGGHSHSFLYNGAVPALLTSPATNETSPVEGPYATIVQSSGKNIPIVTAYWASRYMGVVDGVFTPNGGVTIPGPLNPILLGGVNSTNNVVDDPTTAQQVASLKGPLDALNTGVVGKTNVVLNGERVDVRNKETNLADLITDSMIWYIKNSTSILQTYPNSPVVALLNGGGVRASIPVGDITRGQVVNVLPFGNMLVAKLVTPQALKESLNSGLSQWTGDSGSAGRFPHVANIKYAFNPTLNANARLTRASIINRNGAEVDLDALIAANCPSSNILVLTNDFMAKGGDGYVSLNASQLILDTSLPLDGVTADYITYISPVNQGTDGRITNCNETATSPICSPSTPAAVTCPVPSPPPSPAAAPAPSASSCLKFKIVSVQNRKFNADRAIGQPSKTKDFEACSKACLSAKTCRTLNFDKQTSTCSLFENSRWSTGSTPDNNYTAGYAVCEERSKP